MRLITQADPGDQRRDHRGRDGRDCGGQAERLKQHLQREHRAGQWDVVYCGQAGAGPARDHDPLVRRAQARPTGQPTRKEGADLARGHFAAERRAKPDCDDLQQRVSDGGHGHRSIMRLHGLPDADERAAKGIHAPPPKPRDRSAHREHADPAPRRRFGDAAEEALRADDGIEAVAIGQVLEEVEQHRQQHAADPGAEADRHRHGGEHRWVRCRQRGLRWCGNDRRDTGQVGANAWAAISGGPLFYGGVEYGDT